MDGSGRVTDGSLKGLAEAWRREGWRAADLDPLGLTPPRRAPDLDPAAWGLPDAAAAPFADAYGGRIGWEFSHVPDPRRRDWLAREAEQAPPPAPEHRAGALRLIAEAEALEALLARRLPTTKIFGLSGAEGFLVALEAVIRASPAREVVVGGMHRGRLAQMALVFGKPLVRLIAEARGTPDLPSETGAASDVPYHLGWAGERPDGRRVWVAPHPSHLSVVAPVGQGFARGRPGALSLSLHTDAAMAGQGIVAETFQLAGLPGYGTGGTIHLVLDNQIGFTTDAAAARTAEHCAAVARLTGAPILHVNGEDPDALLRAARTAARWRARFGADVVVRVVAYRRRGHNEMDEPRFTQPVMQARIDSLPPLSGRFAAAAGLPEPDLTAFRAGFDAAWEASGTWRPNAPAAPGLAADAEARMTAPVDTALPLHRLRALLRRLARKPEGMALHPKVEAFLDRRAAMATGEAGLDWATAEALALASLLAEGTPVRLSGQDAVRGAFAQRHLRLADQRSGAVHEVLSGFGAEAELIDTPLIEAAALAFDYGLGLADPTRLTIWEAQFGDFLNVCQSIFDQFVTGGEDRWLLTSGLVMLLPHGYDAGGPDHSTGHPERVLARCAKANMTVLNASTPANWFHALRAQAKAELRKPLVALTPKLLLKHPAAVSPLTDFAPGAGFRPVIAEDGPAERVLVCSGKIALALEAAREARGLGGRVAILRLERLHPFPAAELSAALAHWPDAEVLFVQEEPENLGFLQWLDRRLEAAAGRPVRLVSRPPAASPAVGWRSWHEAEEAALLAAALGPV